jgi:hypothetical protein
MSIFNFIVKLAISNDRSLQVSISLITLTCLVSTSAFVAMFQILDMIIPSEVNAQKQNLTSDNISNNDFMLLNESSPVPTTRERILTDEIIALGEDIDAIKNATQTGDFETVFNKTIEIVSGPNWGNISADLLYRKEILSLNNFVSNLHFLNTLTNNTTQHTKEVNDTIIKQSDALVTNYGKVLDALAVPILDIPKLVTNLIIPAIVVVITILAISKIRKRYKIRY